MPLLAVAALVTGGCDVPTTMDDQLPNFSVAPPSNQEGDVAEFFAPAIAQRFHLDGSTNNSRFDMLTKFTFDGDWDGGNNWQSILWGPYDLSAHVYVSVIEDASRYYIFYGTFHPIDTCTSGLPCDFGLDHHENDMEGALVVVDKRFQTGAWPFGQVVLVETIFHINILAYKNCNLEGGFQIYFAHMGGNTPCIKWSTAPIDRNGTTPAPPKRVQLEIEAEGHGVTVGGTREETVGQNHITRYYPTSGAAGTPWEEYPAGDTPYALLWLDQPELNGESMWDRKAPTNNTFESNYGINSEQIGPLPFFQIGYAFRADFEPGGAMAPWGQFMNDMDLWGDDVRRGDWFLHPAFAITQHLERVSVSGPGWDFCAPGGIGYTPLSIECRDQNPYVLNRFLEFSTLPPSRLTAYVSGGHPRLEWIAGNDVTYYRIYRQYNEGNPWLLWKTTTATTYQDNATSVTSFLGLGMPATTPYAAYRVYLVSGGVEYQWGGKNYFALDTSERGGGGPF